MQQMYDELIRNQSDDCISIQALMEHIGQQYPDAVADTSYMGMMTSFFQSVDVQCENGNIGFSYFRGTDCSGAPVIDMSSMGPGMCNRMEMNIEGLPMAMGMHYYI